jgi:hypothetical protein
MFAFPCLPSSHLIKEVYDKDTSLSIYLYAWPKNIDEGKQHADLYHDNSTSCPCQASGKWIVNRKNGSLSKTSN